MSQQEFDQQDEQAMRVANREPNTPEMATSPVAPRNDSMECNGASGDARAAELRRRILLTAIQVLSCVLVAALFVAALIDPSVVVFLANVGVLVCGMVAAILVDRSIRIRRKG